LDANALAISIAFSNVRSSDALIGFTVANFFFCRRVMVRELETGRPKVKKSLFSLEVLMLDDKDH